MLQPLTRGAYKPPTHDRIFKVVRLANAEWNNVKGRGMRYIVDGSHGIYDAVDDRSVTYAELLQRLPEGLRRYAALS